MSKIELSDSQWIQLASIIDAGIPIESISESLGLNDESRFELAQWCNIITELECWVSIKTVTGCIALDRVASDWFTPAEMKFLGVNIIKRGGKIVGRVALSCEPKVKIGRSTGEVVVESVRKHQLYLVPENIILRLWEIRPKQGSVIPRPGDIRISEMLMRKLAVLKFGLEDHWTVVEINEYKAKLLAMKDTSIDMRSKADERKASI